jgi:hypothetical protein
MWSGWLIRQSGLQPSQSAMTWPKIWHSSVAAFYFWIFLKSKPGGRS